MLPTLADGFDLAQIDEDAVLDRLGAGVGIDRFAEHVFVAHDFVPFGVKACVTNRDLIADCRLALFAHTRESKRWTERRGSVPPGGTKEGEAECFRGVEIAQRYDLDRV